MVKKILRPIANFSSIAGASVAGNPFAATGALIGGGLANAFMKDDKELMARCGKENPFRTPEGYFEHFHDQLMNSLPEPELTKVQPSQVTLFTRIKPWLYMAAMFISTVFVIQGLMYIQETKLPTAQMAESEMIYTDEADLFMATSLYDEYVLYSYLTNNENE